MRLAQMGAQVALDAVGNLTAVRGEGGVLLLCALDEPTFVATGAGPGGLGAAALGSPLPPQELDGRIVRDLAGAEAQLRAGARGLLLDPFGEPPEPGRLYVYGASRRIVGDSLVGPGAGVRALQAAAIAALEGVEQFTLVALARTGVAARGGLELLHGVRRPQGVALEAILEEDGSEIGLGPLEIARAAGYARPASFAWDAGTRSTVCADLPVLASLLQPAGVVARALALAVRYRGSDQERLSIQDAVRLADVLRSALSPS